MFKRRHKCCLCEKKDVNVVGHVQKIYVYNTQHWRFHYYCLEEISKNPTAYSHKQVDYAIEIQDRLNDFAKKIEQREERYYANCDKLVKISKILNGESS
jgi:hypothetical protein